MKYILKLFSLHHLEIKMRYNETILKLSLQSHVYISLAGRPTFVANRAHVFRTCTIQEECLRRKCGHIINTYTPSILINKAFKKLNKVKFNQTLRENYQQL
jgi:hypothetical protein